MLEEKLVFECGNEKILDNENLMQIFWKLFYKEVGYERDEKYFFKVGSIHQPISFDFNLSYSPLSDDSKIHELDDIDFVAKALHTIKRYRMIDDKVYKKIHERSNINGEGEYVIAHDGEPFFRITITPNEKWVYNHVAFEFYNKRGILKHNPNLDIRPNQIEVEISVKNQRKEKLLVNVYNKVLRYYQKENFKVLSK